MDFSGTKIALFIGDRLLVMRRDDRPDIPYPGYLDLPGGVFVTSTPCLGGTWLPPYPVMLPVLRWLGKAPHVTLISPDGLTERATRAGFVDVERPDVGCKAPNVFLLARKPLS